MHKNVFARLAADKAVALGVIEPLYCSCFHIVVLVFLLCSYAGEIGRKTCAGDLLLKRRAAHDRFGLTHMWILRAVSGFSNYPFHSSRKSFIWRTSEPSSAKIRAFCSSGVVWDEQEMGYLCGGTAETTTAMYLPPQLNSATLPRFRT